MKKKMDEIDTAQQRQIDFLIFAFILCHMIQIIWLGSMTVVFFSNR